MTMTLADLERARAARLPPGTVISVLLEQHAGIRDLFSRTMDARMLKVQRDAATQPDPSAAGFTFAMLLDTARDAFPTMRFDS